MKVVVFLDQNCLGESFTWTYGILTLRIIEDCRSSGTGFSSRRAYLKWHFPIPSFLFCLIWNCSVTRACVFLSEGCIVRVGASDERTTAGGWGCTYYLGRCSFFLLKIFFGCSAVNLAGYMPIAHHRLSTIPIFLCQHIYLISDISEPFLNKMKKLNANKLVSTQI